MNLMLMMIIKHNDNVDHHHVAQFKCSHGENHNGYHHNYTQTEPLVYFHKEFDMVDCNTL